MKLLHITSIYYPELQYGGQPFKVHTLSKELTKRGHQVRVATLHSEGHNNDHQTLLEGIPVQYFPWRGRGTWQLPSRAGLLRQLVAESDLVHGFGLYNLLVPLAAWLASREGRPFVVEPLGMYGLRSRNLPAKRLYHRGITQWLFKNAAAVIATSATEEDELRPIVPAGRLMLRRNGLDLTPFHNLPDSSAFRAQHGLAPTDTLILFMGRITPIKNLELLIHAFKAARLSDAHLLLVGPPLEAEYVAKLEHLIAAEGLQAHVRFTGALYGEDKLAALAASDLFVLPSHYESYGNAAAEAVAARVPVLLTESCGIAATIHGRFGLSVPSDASAMAAGIRQLLYEPAWQQTLREGHGAVLRELSWDEPVARMEELYQTVVPPLPKVAKEGTGTSPNQILPLSVVILTHNEEQQIAECLESVKSFAGEVFIVDSGSTDGTLKIAEPYGAHIVTHPFENYAQQRNWAQDHLPIQHKWLLHLDASESVTLELQEAIRRFLADGSSEWVNGALVARRTMFMGRWIRHGGHYPVYHARLFRRDRGRCEERLYDQHFTVEPPLVQLKGDMIDTLSSDLDAWSTRHIRWASHEAAEVAREGTSGARQIRANPVGNPIEQRRWIRERLFSPTPLFLRAFGYFLYRYILRLGFLDGTEGLIFHFLQGCWFRFYVDAKIWEAQRHTPCNPE